MQGSEQGARVPRSNPSWCALWEGAPAPTPSLDPVFALPLGVGAVTSGQVAVRMEETQTDVSAKPRGPVAVTWSLGCVSPPLTFPKGWSGQVKRTEMVRE